MEIIKNPIVVGLVFSGMSYGYLSYNANIKNEENKNKKNKKGRKEESETVNMLIPLAIFIIVWFITYAYLEYSTDSITTNDSNVLQSIPNMPQFGEYVPMPLSISPKYNFIKDVASDTSDPQSFSIINTGIKIPSKLPDVLLDVMN